jgi:hypothetical protein
MNRKLFLRNAMMAIAVSLVPKILQPVVPELVGGGTISWKPKYDPDKTYRVNMEWGGVVWSNGKILNEMDRIMFNQFYND